MNTAHTTALSTLDPGQSIMLVFGIEQPPEDLKSVRISASGRAWVFGKSDPANGAGYVSMRQLPYHIGQTLTTPDGTYKVKALDVKRVSEIKLTAAFGVEPALNGFTRTHYVVAWNQQHFQTHEEIKASLFSAQVPEAKETDFVTLATFQREK